MLIRIGCDQPLTLVLCGDFYQLDPVCQSTMWGRGEGSRYFETRFKLAMILKTNVRQGQDRRYADLIQAIQQGNVLPRHWDTLIRCCRPVPDNHRMIAATAFHQNRKFYNFKATITAAAKHEEDPGLVSHSSSISLLT